MVSKIIEKKFKKTFVTSYKTYTFIIIKYYEIIVDWKKQNKLEFIIFFNYFMKYWV